LRTVPIGASHSPVSVCGRGKLSVRRGGGPLSTGSNGCVACGSSARWRPFAASPSWPWAASDAAAPAAAAPAASAASGRACAPSSRRLARVRRRLGGRRLVVAPLAGRLGRRLWPGLLVLVLPRGRLLGRRAALLPRLRARIERAVAAVVAAGRRGLRLGLGLRLRLRLVRGLGRVVAAAEVLAAHRLAVPLGSIGDVRSAVPVVRVAAAVSGRRRAVLFVRVAAAVAGRRVAVPFERRRRIAGAVVDRRRRRLAALAQGAPALALQARRLAVRGAPPAAVALVSAEERHQPCSPA
jgi:hypothetical protein